MVNDEATPPTSTPVAGTSRSFETATSGPNWPQGAGHEESDFRAGTVKQIETAVAAFRAGKTKKAQSIYQIGQILAAQPGGDERLKSEALEQYSTTLDRIESLSAKSAQHGERISGVAAGKRKEDHAGRSGGSPEPDGNPPEELRSPEVDSFLNEFAKGKRGFDEADEDGSESGNESNTDQTSMLEKRDGRTRSSESLNRKCRGTRPKGGLECGHQPKL